MNDDDVRLEVENVDLRRLLVQAGIDAAEQKGAERLQRLLLEELHHRVKNTLTTVIAITTQTLKTAANMQEGSRAIEHRLIALGRAHDLLLQARWTSAALGDLLTTAVEPFDVGEGDRFLIQASNIEVSSASVLPLAMVLNELCTNALKYGALSNDTGQVEITSIVGEPGGQFRLTWTETGGPAVSPPTRRSFGTRLIEHTFVSQLQGQAHLSFEPSGVVCILDIPLASLKPPHSN